MKIKPSASENLRSIWPGRNVKLNSRKVMKISNTLNHTYFRIISGPSPAKKQKMSPEVPPFLKHRRDGEPSGRAGEINPPSQPRLPPLKLKVKRPAPEQASTSTTVPTISSSTCKRCSRQFRRFDAYQRHVERATCSLGGHFCRFCSKRFTSNMQKARHENRHILLEQAKSQKGSGLQHSGRVHGCSIYEENFNFGEILTIEQAYALKRREVRKLLVQKLREHKIIRFGIILTGRFEIPTEDDLEDGPPSTDKEMTMPMRTPYRILLVGDEAEIPAYINRCLKDTLSRVEDLELRGSGWSIRDIITFRVELGKCSLIGGCDDFQVDEKHMKGSEYLIDVPIRNERCFISALAQHYFRGKCTEQMIDAWAKENLKLKGIEFPMSITKIAAFEKKNSKLDLRINVFLKEGNQCYPAYRSKKTSENVANLVLLRFSSQSDESSSDCEMEEGDWDDNFWLNQKYHYCYITDVDKYLNLHQNHSGARRRYGSLHCDNCLANFTNRKTLDEHRELCLKNETQFIKMPKQESLSFTKHHLKFGYPILGFLDFESTLVPTDRSKHPNCKNCRELGDQSLCKHATQEQNEQKPMCYSLYFIDRARNIVFERTRIGENVMKHFFRDLRKAEKKLIKGFQAKKVLRPWTEQEMLNYEEAKECHYCGQRFKRKGELKKVRDHDHVSGAALGAAHRSCNREARAKKGLIVYCHNLTGYDSHFIIKHMTKYQGKRRFTGIPNNTEKFKTFDVGRTKFVDSRAFLDASLAELVDDLVQEKNDFKILENSGIYETEEQRNLLISQKGVFPYEYVTGTDVLQETKLPPKDKFYSMVKESHVNDEEYQHALKTFEAFGCKNLKDYCKLYCRLDTLQLAEAVLAFVEEVKMDFGLDATNFISLPQLAWQCMLKKTGVELDYMPDQDMIQLLENNIRGGVSYVNVRSVNTAEDGGELMYLDFTNLYGYAQKQKLPCRNYRWLTSDEVANFDVMAVEDNGDLGYGLEVDLHYPEHLHKLHNDLPLAPEKMDIFYNDLSEYSKECLDNIYKGNPKRYHAQKLAGTFRDKKNYFTHIKNLKYYLDQGLIVTKIHRIIEFEQEDFMTEFIDYSAEKRKKSKSAFKCRVAKLIANATYGRFIMNVRNHMEVKILSRGSTIEKYMGNPRFKSMRFLNDDLVAIFLKKKKVTLDKHWMVGWTILELSKLAMFELYYDVVIPRFGIENVDIVMSDTDSYIFHIHKHSKREIELKLCDVMDFSNYPKDHEFYNDQRAKIPGFVKNETPSSDIIEIVAPKSKCYAFKTKLNTGSVKEEKKCKGVTKARIKRLKFNSYKKCITSITGVKATVARIQARNHRISTVKQTRLCLSSFDDKRFLLHCGRHSKPHSETRPSETCLRCIKTV